MKGVVAIGSVDDDLVTPGGDGEMAMTAATATPPTAEIRPTAGTHPTADPAPPTSPPTTSGGARARARLRRGALLVPLFYAAHKMASEE